MVAEEASKTTTLEQAVLDDVSESLKSQPQSKNDTDQKTHEFDFFKEESTKVSDLPDNEKKALQDLKVLVQQALENHLFSSENTKDEKTKSTDEPTKTEPVSSSVSKTGEQVSIWGIPLLADERSDKCHLSWEVRVIGWGVRYGAEFLPSSEGRNYTVTIHKTRKIASSDEPVVCDSFKTSEPGKVVVTIDNPSSKKKKLLYRLKNQPSSD
ncbi:hypothetical protein K1719_014666 [Acacia pycnantha]|nr:hypothetical protein K1719_014666 [Acacia pycnantha]